MTPLDALAGEPRWVAWRYELRAGKKTKVPYSPAGRTAKSDDSSTWGTRAEAEARAKRIVNGHGGGTGFMLGEASDGVAFGGVDLDTCRSPDGSLQPWANEIVDRLGSYTEISPSGTGAKIFFRYRAVYLPELRSAMGTDHGRGFKRRGGDHPPAIELYLSNRYFTVTGQWLDRSPAKLMTVDKETLLWVIREAGPAFVGAANPKTVKVADNSRSAAVFRIARRMRRAGQTYEKFREAVRANPNTASWFIEKGLANGERELHRAFDRAGNEDGKNLPEITVEAGLRHEAADAGIAALRAADVAFYQRDQSIVRVCAVPAKCVDGSIIRTPGIAEVGYAFLSRALGGVARWQKCDRRGKLVRIDPPRPMVEQISNMAGEWPFPVLAGVVGTPTMRPDGTLLLAEGYDASTGLVLVRALRMPPISEQPTQAEAEAALRLIDGLLNEFPFRDGGGIESVDRAVALSELMTPVLRGAMQAAPMHLANAPQPGTGKSYLADLTSEIATGKQCAVVAFSPNPAETEKRLNGSALEGHPIIALDNASGAIEGDLLCQLTERPLLQLRPLGTSKMTRIANTFTVLANGNNTVIAADMVRRTIECRFDANMEAPETRVFRDDPLAKIRQNRGAYVAAVLTIARAYICAGKPGRLGPLASYEPWSDFVRSPLVWLGRADPVASMASLRSLDPTRQTRTAVFTAWANELDVGGAYLTPDLIERANDQGTSGDYLRPRLRDALLEVARSRVGGIDAKRLGRWLAKTENNLAAGLKLTSDRGDAARPRWRLVKA
jgi:putative DNA primase/helicase